MKIWNNLRRSPAFGYVLSSVLVAAMILASAAAGPGTDRTPSQQDHMDAVVGALKAELTVHVTGQQMRGEAVSIHNPFDGLLNKPETYQGRLLPSQLCELPQLHWAFCLEYNAVVYCSPSSTASGEFGADRNLSFFAVHTILADGEIVDLELVKVPTPGA